MKNEVKEAKTAVIHINAKMINLFNIKRFIQVDNLLLICTKKRINRRCDQKRYLKFVKKA